MPLGVLAGPRYYTDAGSCGITALLLPQNTNTNRTKPKCKWQQWKRSHCIGGRAQKNICLATQNQPPNKADLFWGTALGPLFAFSVLMAWMPLYLQTLRMAFRRHSHFVKKGSNSGVLCISSCPFAEPFQLLKHHTHQIFKQPKRKQIRNPAHPRINVNTETHSPKKRRKTCTETDAARETKKRCRNTASRKPKHKHT